MLTLRNIPFKNIKAHPVRTLILCVLTFAQAVCVFGTMLLVLGMRQELALAEARLGADILVYPTAAASKISMKELLMQGTPVKVYKDKEMLSRLDSCEDIAAVTHQIYISDTLPDGSDIWIVGYEPETDFVITPWFSDRTQTELSVGSVAAGSRVQTNGDGTVTLLQKAWPVGARLEETGSLLDTAVFVPMETLKQLLAAAAEAGIDAYANVYPDSDFSAALVRVKDRNRLQAAADWINIYVRKVTAVRSEETLTQAAAGIRGTTKTMAAVSGMAWLILLLALGILQSILMKERAKEFFVWYTVGASRRVIGRVIRSEALAVHSIGAAAGVVLAGMVWLLFGKQLLPGCVISPGSAAAAAVIAVIFTAAVGCLFAHLSLCRVVGRQDLQMLLKV